MASKVKVGDYVLITECRPISKIKHHVLLSKVGEEK
jgi:ribosomal protein S17